MYESFYNNPVIRHLSVNQRWTVSDKDKVPIDMTDLLYRGKVHGALMNEEGHNPFVDLNTLVTHLPNAANNAYYIDAKADGVMILDIEPGCPEDIRNKLLRLPAYYGEFSMSGKGYHLILPVPKEYADVSSCSVAVKDPNGYYEFLCNHCVTFTRNVIPTGYTPDIGQGSYDEFLQLWCDIASKVDLNQKRINLTALKEEETTQWSDYIQTILQSDNKAYKKTPEDFADCSDDGYDGSRYEHGYTTHVYYVLWHLLKSLGVFYTKQQMIWEIYRATSELIPYRPKHDTIHNGMPWLLYEASVVVERSYDEGELLNAISFAKVEDELDELDEEENNGEDDD